MSDGSADTQATRVVLAAMLVALLTLVGVSSGASDPPGAPLERAEDATAPTTSAAPPSVLSNEVAPTSTTSTSEQSTVTHDHETTSSAPAPGEEAVVALDGDDVSAADFPPAHQTRFPKDARQGRTGFISTCPHSHTAPDDPIVFPGEPGASHLHVFFGNTGTDAHTTTRSLVEHERTSCEHIDDLSAYWVPAGYQNGRQVAIAGTSMYYFLDKVADPSATQPMPLGLRMIAGDARATTGPTKQVGWFEEHRHASNRTGESTTMVRAERTEQVIMRLNFPNCWDGENLDSPDHKSHMAYVDDDRRCPATHPVLVPQLTMFVRFDAPGGDGFELASGPWFTMHGDFWNGWHPDTMEALIDECLDRHCDRVRTD